MEDIKLALELKQALDKLRPIDKEQEARIMQKFRLDWNYQIYQKIKKTKTRKIFI